MNFEFFEKSEFTDLQFSLNTVLLVVTIAQHMLQLEMWTLLIGVVFNTEMLSSNIVRCLAKIKVCTKKVKFMVDHGDYNHGQ